MNPKKPDRMKAKSAGISMQPELTAEARIVAAEKRFSGLSGWVQQLVAEGIEAHRRLKLAAEQLEQSGRRDLQPSAERKRKASAAKAATVAASKKAEQTDKKKRR